MGHRPGAEGVEPVVGESALADISPNPSLGVGRGHPAEGKRPRRRPAFERSVGVFHAERAAEDRRRGDADVGQEALRPVAAVKQRALVVVVAVVVVPIDEGGGRLRGELHRMHRQHARHVNLAGARHESLAHHAHQGADVAAERLLHRRPALDRRGVDGIGFHPPREHDPERGHFDELRLRHARRRRIARDVGKLRPHGRIIAGDRGGLRDELRQIDRGDADPVPLQDLLAVAHGVERARAGSDGAEPHASHPFHHPADAEKVGEIGGEARAGDRRHVAAGERKANAGLHEIVADRNLAAEGIPAAGHAELAEVVGRALHEHRHVESRELERVGHPLLVAEVGEHHQHAVDRVPMAAKKVGADAGLRMGLDAAELRLLGRDHHRRHAPGLEQGKHLAACLADQLIGKEIAVADDDAERRCRKRHGGQAAWGKLATRPSLPVRGIIVPASGGSDSRDSRQDRRREEGAR